MSVNHYLLPITELELAMISQTPHQVHEVVTSRAASMRSLGENGVAIVALTAGNDEDPMAFITCGASDTVSGWVGKCVREDGQILECEEDMGYGPASYYRNDFLQVVARRLQPITVDVFAENCDPKLLADNHVYPAGWENPGRKDRLVEAFSTYRECVIAAAMSGQHLLVWCA